MNDLEHKNETRSMKKNNSYGDTQMDKSNELNDSMTINEGSRDEFESTIHSIGGAKNA